MSALDEELDSLERLNAAEARGLPILREMFAALKPADSAVQTGQDTQTRAEQGVDADLSLAVCLRAPRSGKLRVVLAGSPEQLQLTAAGWEVADDVVLRGTCACGCGLPVPHAGLSVNGREYTNALQKYADPEGCRKALYALQHPTLDLSGLPPVVAKNAARMAGEAARAARMGQVRATVDAHSNVTHVTEDRKRGPDNRPSNRLRLSPSHWQMLAEIQELGYRRSLSFSALVSQLIEEELDLCRARLRQEGEHDDEQS